MPYFLSDNKIAIGPTFELKGDEADHVLLSRRAKIGDRIKVQGSNGKRFTSEITKIGKHQLMLKSLEEIVVPPEPLIKIVLYQSAVATNTLDTILQKATELAAAEIVLFNSQYTATRLSADKFRDKFFRWQKVLWEAAKQCERANIPNLRYLSGVDELAAEATKLDQLFVFDITGQKLQINRQSLIVNRLGVVIGPEGGLSSDELKLLSGLPNSRLTSLGPLLLKADTAAVAALAIVQG